MKKSDTDDIQFNYLIKIDLDLFGKPSAITVDAQPHEQEAVNSAIRAAIAGSNERQAETSVVIVAKKTFESAIAEYMLKATGKPQTKQTYRSKFAHAQAYFGGPDADVLKIDQADLVQYADHVVATVPNVTTQSHYISVVTGFLNWHRTRNKGLSALTTKTLLPKKNTPESDDRDPFTLVELRHVFENAAKYRFSTPSKFWATVAPALLGCRIEELCQVHLKTDLVHDEEVNIWYLVFDGRPDPDGVTRKSMKKLSSWRRVPIHSSLVSHGFVDFLQDQYKKGYERPFLAEWNPREKATEVGKIIKWSQYVSKWGGRELVVAAEKFKFDPNRDVSYFHSMRHTFKTVLGEAGVSQEISEALAGRRYGGADAERYEKLKQNHRRLSLEGIEKGLDQISALLDEALAGSLPST